MSVIELALVALVVLLVIVWWWRRRGGSDQPERAGADDALDTVAAWPPEGVRVLTTPEQRAYQLLVRNLPPGYAVLAQVPLARFLRVPTRHSYREWIRRVGRLNADLLVCDSTFQVIAVVNVRAPLGKDSERGLERHKRMDRVLRKASIRVLNWQEDALPQASLVAELVFGRAPAELSSAPMPLAPAAAPTAARGTRAAPADDNDDFADERSGEPLPSTFFDDLDTKPAPLPRPKARE